MTWELWPTPDQVTDRVQEYAVFNTLGMALHFGMPYPDNWPRKEKEMDTKKMQVDVHNIDQSQPMCYDGVDNTYVKDGFYCILRRDRNEVIKLPIARIFRIIETYDPLLG